MKKPKIDDKLTLLTDFGETEAICTEVLDDPATAEGVLLKVMARGPFQEGQQCWIVDRDGSKIGATVESVLTQNNRSRSDAFNCAPRLRTTRRFPRESCRPVSFHRARDPGRPAQGRFRGTRAR